MKITKEFVIEVFSAQNGRWCKPRQSIIFSLVFLHKDSISSLKFRRLSILIPKSFSHLLTDKTLKGERITLTENEKVVSVEKCESSLEMKRAK